MIKKKITHWQNVPEIEGLLFFAQRLSEMLFDHTIDTYKPMVMNTHLLCKEALRVIELIEKQLIDKNNLKSILEELNWSYASDAVAKKILINDGSTYLPISNFENIDDVKVRIELVLNKMPLSKYITINKQLLKEAIISNKKKSINKLTSNIITSLKTFGYSQPYLYHRTNLFFYNRNKPITNFSQIDDFLDLFPLKKSKYQVLIIGSEIYLKIKDSSEAFGFEILEDKPTKFNDGAHSYSLNKDEVYILNSETEATDFISARLLAERAIEKLSSIFVFFHHKNRPVYRPDFLIYDSENKAVLHCPKLKSPMAKGFDFREEIAAKKLFEMMHSFSLERSSFERVDKALDLHSIAVHNRNIDNQILSLWIAFETLVPNFENKGKLQQVIDSLLPVLKTKYLDAIISDLVNTLIRQKKEEIKTLICEIDIEKSQEENTVALILANDLAHKRIELYSLLDDYPLLRFRVFELNEKLSSGAGILDFIKTHQLKVEWQLRRIYRTRNLIVHSGKSFRNTELLVENAHTYLDSLINQLFDLASGENGINTIEQGIAETLLQWEKKEKFLKMNKDIQIDTKNIHEFI